MKPITEFKTKSGKEIEIWEPSMERLKELLEFFRRLTDEDAYINRYDVLNSEVEKKKLENELTEIKNGISTIIWAVYKNSIVATSKIYSLSGRSYQVGNIGLMVDRDFRSDGIGKFMISYILSKAKRMKLRIIILDVFAENMPAIELYRKFGFKKYGLLPKALFRKGKYSDEIKMYKNL